MPPSHTVIDISRPLTAPDSTWPGDPPFTIRAFATLEAHGHHSSALSMSAHCGTHLDMPAHVLPHGATVEAYAASRFVLDALVLDAPPNMDVPEATGGVVDEALVHRALAGSLPSCPVPLEPGMAALWRTGRHGRVTAQAARLLAESGIGLVGVESASVDGMGDGLPAHHALLGAGVPVLENLDLAGASTGPWLLVCPPLPAPGLEASPVRALLLGQPGQAKSCR